MQVGQLRTTNMIGGSVAYPLARSGLAQQGLQVYRANGCAYCHTQQTTQRSTTCDVVLTDAGTNQAQVLVALAGINPKLTESERAQMLAALPKAVLKGVDKHAAERALKTLTAAAAKGSIYIVPLGPDLARGWGKRRSVAEDFLFDFPVMLGSERIGPDLANIGARQPDPNWHYRHLYYPRSEVKNSTMPPYRFLFAKQRIQGQRSPDAILVEQDYEIVPGEKARALAAYLVSLRADAPLFVAPLTLPGGQGPQATNAAAADATGTNSASGTGGTNAAPTNAPSK